MAKRERSITRQDVNQIVGIIGRMKTKPTWSKIVVKIGEAGLPFKVRSLQNHPEIVDAYQAKVVERKSLGLKRKAERAHEGIPKTEKAIADLISDLKARLDKVEKQNVELQQSLEAVLLNAERQGVARDVLNRPLRPLKG